MNTHEIGRQLENYIVEKFAEIGYKFARRSPGSGNKGSVADINGVNEFAVECKNDTKNKNITIKENVWNKLILEIPLHSVRIPLYALQNKNKKRWVCLDVEDFFKLIGEKK